MKLFSRDFTRRETILILALILMLSGLSYYRFVDVPIRERLESAQTQKDNLNTEITIAQTRLARLQNMKQEMDLIIEEGSLAIMGSYNNSKNEIEVLNKVLKNAETYSISFTNITRESNLIRRTFTLSFVAKDYASATELIRQLYYNPWRCLISDIQFRNTNSGTQANLLTGNVTVSMNATFYETMAGGTADAGLPADTAAAEESE